MSNFHPRKVVGRGCETQFEGGGIKKFGGLMVNPLNPHDALKHHFASLKNNLIPVLLNENFHGTF